MRNKKQYYLTILKLIIRYFMIKNSKIIKIKSGHL